jgi:isopentenyl phosphate kinase
MIKVKTFTSPLRIFHVHNELMELDKAVNDFLQQNNIKKVISVGDSTTTTNGGTMGIIRVVTYEE